MKPQTHTLRHESLEKNKEGTATKFRIEVITSRANRGIAGEGFQLLAVRCFLAGWWFCSMSFRKLFVYFSAVFLNASLMASKTFTKEEKKKDLNGIHNLYLQGKWRKYT